MKKEPVVETTLRIPGKWSNPGELIERLPDGHKLTHKALIMPDGVEIEFAPLRPDDQFARIFGSACRRPPTMAELSTISEYSLNVGLIGPGGSMESALTTMQAAAAMVRAGGAGCG